MGITDDAVGDKNLHKRSKKGKEKDSVPESTKKRKSSGHTSALQEIEKHGSSLSTHSQEKKMQENVEEASNNHMGIEPIQPEIKKEKRKRKRDARDDTAEPDASARKKKKARKVQEMWQETRKSPDPAADNESSEKTRKREKNREKKSSESTTKLGIQSEETTNEKSDKQKKRKNKTGFPDPEEDNGEGELSDQAKKALAYAFTQFREPGLWKFNKAKQNWLVRNFWSSKAIPEKYDGLVIKYLSAVQGNARENLIKTCREVIAQPPSDAGQDPQKSDASLGGSLIDAAFPTNPTEDSKKKARVQALLQALTSKFEA